MDGEVRPNGVRSLSVSPNGSFLAVGLRNGSVDVWNLSDLPNHRHERIQAHSDWVNGVSLFDDGQTLLSWSQDDTIRKWERHDDNKWTLSGELKFDFIGGEPEAAVDPSRQQLVLVSRPLVLSTSIRSLNEPEQIRPNGEQFVSFEIDGFGTCLRFSPDGRFLAGELSEGFGLIDASRGRVFREFRDPRLNEEAHIGGAFGFSFDPTGSLVASTGFDQRLKLWDTVSGELLLDTGFSGTGILMAEFSPDGRWLAVTPEGETQLFEVHPAS